MPKIIKDNKDAFELFKHIYNKQDKELLWAFIPESSEKITKQFSVKNIKKGEILFEKIK